MYFQLASPWENFTYLEIVAGKKQKKEKKELDINTYIITYTYIYTYLRIRTFLLAIVTYF